MSIKSFFAVLIFATSAAHAEESIQQCSGNAGGEGLLAGTWNQFLQALQKRPTEAQRLARLREL